VDWNQAIMPLIEKYRGKPHPLNHGGNRYRLLIMVLLSAQDSDAHINGLASGFFAEFPTMMHLARATEDRLTAQLSSVRNFQRKIQYLMKLALLVGSDENIPTTHAGLTALPGLGSKSANVILHESGLPAEGIIVDLHVIRVAPRLGLTPPLEDGNKVEKLLLPQFRRDLWGEVGMALTFLGRETCRPTKPHCPECLMNAACTYPDKTR
jgi:endonuclease-3